MLNKFKTENTHLKFKYEFSPLKNIKYDLSGIIGNFNAELIKKFFNEYIAKKANIVISELFNNVVENVLESLDRIVDKIKKHL